MKSGKIVCALAAAALGFGSVSYAQGYDRDRANNAPPGLQQHRDGRDFDRRGDNERWQRDGRGTNEGWQRDGRDFERRGNNERWQRDQDRGDRRADRGYRGDRHADVYYYGARGPEWRRGGHIPSQYRSRQYVVEDWRTHQLYAPPHGYQWVQVGGDYVLVAIATGIILQLLLNQ